MLWLIAGADSVHVTPSILMPHSAAYRISSNNARVHRLIDRRGIGRRGIGRAVKRACEQRASYCSGRKTYAKPIIRIGLMGSHKRGAGNCHDDEPGC